MATLKAEGNLTLSLSRRITCILGAIVIETTVQSLTFLPLHLICIHIDAQRWPRQQATRFLAPKMVSVPCLFALGRQARPHARPATNRIPNRTPYPKPGVCAQAMNAGVETMCLGPRSGGKFPPHAIGHALGILVRSVGTDIPTRSTSCRGAGGCSRLG